MQNNLHPEADKDRITKRLGTATDDSLATLSGLDNPMLGLNQLVHATQSAYHCKYKKPGASKRSSQLTKADGSYVRTVMRPSPLANPAIIPSIGANFASILSGPRRTTCGASNSIASACKKPRRLHDTMLLRRI